jgi:hypothetical protein
MALKARFLSTASGLSLLGRFWDSALLLDADTDLSLKMLKRFFNGIPEGWVFLQYGGD